MRDGDTLAIVDMRKEEGHNDGDKEDGAVSALSSPYSIEH